MQFTENAKRMLKGALWDPKGDHDKDHLKGCKRRFPPESSQVKASAINREKIRHKGTKNLRRWVLGEPVGSITLTHHFEQEPCQPSGTLTRKKSDLGFGGSAGPFLTLTNLKNGGRRKLRTYMAVSIL